MKSQRVKFLISITDQLIKSCREESQNLFKILSDKLHAEITKNYEGTWHVIVGSDFGAEVGM